MKKIIYVMDPHCGWCYGNSNNITAIQKEFKDVFNIELLVGGMWLGQNAPKGGANLSQFLQNHAPRMAETTGVEVNQKYFDLAKNSAYTFSSMEPCAAIILVKEIAPEQTTLFAKNVQLALFVAGKRLDEKETYHQILDDMCIDKETFGKHWMGAENISKTKAEFSIASKYANGFPALVMQKGNEIETLASGYFNLDEMIRTLKDQQ